MFHLKQFIKIANKLDELALKEAADVVDEYVAKKADLRLSMEKDVSKKDDKEKDKKTDKKEDEKDNDKEEVEVKKKKITLVFD